MFEPSNHQPINTEDELTQAFLIATTAVQNSDLSESTRLEAVNLIHDTLLAHAACHLVLRDWQLNQRLSTAAVGALMQATEKSRGVQNHIKKLKRNRKY